MKKFSWTIFAVLLCGFLPAVSNGDLITIGLTAEVTGVSDIYGHLEDKIHVGDTVTGTYTYDSATLDSEPDPAVGRYEYSTPPAGICLTVGGLEFKTDPCSVGFELYVADNYLGEDRYGVSSYSNLPLPNGTPVQSIAWYLEDSTGTALSSDALPLTEPNLADWDYNWGLHITTDRDFGIGATITSAVLIPEPATLLLLAFGVTLFKRR
jgi:hypothetical protein